MELLKKMLTTPSVSGSELHFQKMLIEEMKAEIKAEKALLKAQESGMAISM